MTFTTTEDPLPGVMRQLKELAQTGKKDEFAAYCKEIIRQFGRDTEALVRLARFCQKQKWHGGFELFMLRLADRLPANRINILLTLAEYFLGQGVRRGLEHLRGACELLAKADTPTDVEGKLVERALAVAVGHLSRRDDWEDVVKTFPEELQGDLYLELAEKWGTEQPERAFRAYRRGLRAKPDAWPGQALADAALAYAAALASHDMEGAMQVLTWAATYADDPRLEAEAAAIALEAGDNAAALRLSRRVYQRKPEDLDNLGRLVGLQAAAGEWGEVAALAPSIVAAVVRLNPWQRDEHVPVVDLALEAWVRTGQAAQAEAALKQLHVDDGWLNTWRMRLADATSTS